MYAIYIVTFKTINIPPMLAYIPLYHTWILWVLMWINMISCVKQNVSFCAAQCRNLSAVPMAEVTMRWQRQQFCFRDQKFEALGMVQ